jgi:hypothetical protein
MRDEFMQKNRILNKFDMKNGKFRYVRNAGIVLKYDYIFTNFLSMISRFSLPSFLVLQPLSSDTRAPESQRCHRSR